MIRDLNKIGYPSCQIINVKLLKAVFKKEKKYLLKTKFPQNFLILKLINKYKNWKILELNCIFNHLVSFDDKWIKMIHAWDWFRDPQKCESLTYEEMPYQKEEIK